MRYVVARKNATGGNYRIYVVKAVEIPGIRGDSVAYDVVNSLNGTRYKALSKIVYT